MSSGSGADAQIGHLGPIHCGSSHVQVGLHQLKEGASSGINEY